jgi:ribosomal protein S18 acetylase RimI-like enzyme
MQAVLRPETDVADFAIRPATLADAPIVAELVEALNRSEGDPTGYVTPETMARDLARGQISVVVAERTGAISAYCLFHFGYEPTYAASGLFVCDLYVRPEARGQGIARSLLAEVARRAKAEGGTFVWWTSRPGNVTANAVYENVRAYREPVLAHAVFDDAFEALVAHGEAGRAR